MLKPDHPRDPDFQEALRALAPDCCPVVAYGALLPQSALDIPEHGWVNLHFSVLPAWRGAAPVQHADLGRRRGHRRDHVPDRQGARRRADVRPDDRDGSAPTTPPATCWRGSPRAAPACWCPPSTASRTARSRRASSRRRASASPPRSPSRTPASTGPSPPSPSTGASARARPPPAPGRRCEGERIKLGPVTAGRRPRSPPGELAGRQERRRSSAPAPARSGSAGQGVRQEGDARRRLGPRRPRRARRPVR